MTIQAGMGHTLGSRRSNFELVVCAKDVIDKGHGGSGGGGIWQAGDTVVADDD